VPRGAAFFPPHNDLSLGEDRCAAEKMLVGDEEESNHIWRSRKQGCDGKDAFLRPLAHTLRKKPKAEAFLAENEWRGLTSELIEGRR
jgi:hypothetical protein